MVSKCDFASEIENVKSTEGSKQAERKKIKKDKSTKNIDRQIEKKIDKKN